PPSLPVHRLSLADRLGRELSRCACAYALAILATERALPQGGTDVSPIVVKVGGSLFDLPDLGSKLGRWLKALSSQVVLIVPGGGSAAEVVRDLDRRHTLGEDRSHWLALFALGLNARFLAHVLPGAAVIQDLAACRSCWRQGKIPILD